MSSNSRFNNKWPCGRTSWAPFALPTSAKKRAGILPAHAILDTSVGTETVLYMFDPTDFIHQIAALKPFTLVVKTGLVRMDHGPVFFVLYCLPNPQDGAVFVSFEHTLNPHDHVALAPYYDLARQTHWHVFVVDGEGEELAWFELQNCFGLGPALEAVARATANMPCKNFDEAKREYTKAYTVDDLLAMT